MMTSYGSFMGGGIVPREVPEVQTRRENNRLL
jgi:hypothetical protein